MAVFTGCGTAIATPMFADGGVDYKRFKELIEWQISEGVDAIIAAGTTGEASTLDDDEHVEVVRFCVEKVAGRVPVIAGAGSNDTRHGINLAKRMEKVGADALLLVTPYYNKCSQQGLIEHYNATVKDINIPSILYSVPGRTAVNIAPDTVVELAKNPKIVGIKEASGDIAQVAEICRRVPEGFSVYSGNDDMVIPLMSLGGVGYISVLANVIPGEASQMSKAALEGDWKKAKAIQLKTKPLTDALFTEVNPIPVKAALAMMGKIEMEYRLPLCKPSADSQAKIKQALKEYGLI